MQVSRMHGRPMHDVDRAVNMLDYAKAVTAQDVLDIGAFHQLVVHFT